MPSTILSRPITRITNRFLYAQQAGTGEPFPVIRSMDDPDAVEDRHTRDLEEGCWRYSLQGFCLGIGRAEPVRGSVYDVAPVKSDTDLGRIVTSFGDYPEIAQEQGQRLIWSLMSGTPVTELSVELRAIAEKLSPGIGLRSGLRVAVSRIIRHLLLNGLARFEQFLPRDVVTAMRSVDTVARRVRSSVPYQELERLAMAATPPDLKRDAREQWLISSEGYYMKLIPGGYRGAEVIVRVPPWQGATVNKDSFDRITSVASDNVRFDLVYGDRGQLNLDGGFCLDTWLVNKIIITGEGGTFTLEDPGWIADNFGKWMGIDPDRHSHMHDTLHRINDFVWDLKIMEGLRGRELNQQHVTDVLLAIHMVRWASSMLLLKKKPLVWALDQLRTEVTYQTLNGLYGRLLNLLGLEQPQVFRPEMIIGLPGDNRQQRLGLRFVQ